MICPIKYLAMYTYDFTMDLIITRIDIDGEVLEDEYNPDIKNPII